MKATTTRRALFAAAAGIVAAVSVPAIASLGGALGTLAARSPLQALRDEYFNIKRWYDTAVDYSDEEATATANWQHEVDVAIVASTPACIPDMIAYLEVTIADFEQFHMDDGKGGLEYLPDDGERMAYLSMVHSLRLFRTLSEQVSA